MRAEHELLHVLEHVGLEVLGGVRTVHHCALRVGRVGGLRTQLGPKELGHLGRVSVEGRRELDDVWEDGFDPVSLAFYLQMDDRCVLTKTIMP